MLVFEVRIVSLKGLITVKSFSVLLNLDEEHLGHYGVSRDEPNITQRLLVAWIRLKVIDLVQEDPCA